jgi:hypothetical protein
MMKHHPIPRLVSDLTDINIEDDQNLCSWTEKFGCSKEQLKEAVKRVGSSPGPVRAELGRRVPLAPSLDIPLFRADISSARRNAGV